MAWTTKVALKTLIVVYHFVCLFVSVMNERAGCGNCAFAQASDSQNNKQLIKDSHGATTRIGSTTPIPVRCGSAMFKFKILSIHVQNLDSFLAARRIILSQASSRILGMLANCSDCSCEISNRIIDVRD